MKTALSVPDDVLQQIERLARRLKQSRSARYRQAVAKYLRHARAAVIDALDGLARASVVVPPP
jgi:predicted transcriptional regulator